MICENKIVIEDLDIIISSVESINNLENKTLMITGGAGFLGYYFILSILRANDTIFKKKCKVICVDNFIRGYPDWLIRLKKRNDITILKHNITKKIPSKYHNFDFLIHAASIASPIYYRKFPIETMDANVNGLRHFLDYIVSKKGKYSELTSMLFFSTSEIYGDPSPDAIPTKEDYRGFVSCTGPRACYDESKRYGETLCTNFVKVHNIPVKVARPFNNYGPGLSIHDKRVLPDFCKNVLDGHDIIMLSDGSPTRTFCYVSDAITGYFKLLFSKHNGESFNIGIEKPEISMKDLAELVIEIANKELGIKGVKLVRKISSDKDYLTDNPNRRCPSINKAKSLLNYNPTIDIREGIRRSLLWYSDNYNKGRKNK